MKLLEPKGKISDHFRKIEDPRIERTKRHKLIDILTIAILSVICGADSWVDMESWTSQAGLAQTHSGTAERDSLA